MFLLSLLTVMLLGLPTKLTNPVPQYLSGCNCPHPAVVSSCIHAVGTLEFQVIFVLYQFSSNTVESLLKTRVSKLQYYC